MYIPLIMKQYLEYFHQIKENLHTYKPYLVITFSLIIKLAESSKKHH